MSDRKVVCTIGHSTRSLEEFVGLLQANRVNLNFYSTEKLIA